MEKKNSKPIQNQNQKPGRSRFNLTWLYLIIGFGLLAVYFWDFNPKATKEIDNVKFREMVVDKDVEKAVFVSKDNRVNIFIKGKSLETKDCYKEVKENLDGPQFYLAQSDYKAFNDELNRIVDEEVAFVIASDSTLTAADAKSLRQDYLFSVMQDNTRNWTGEILLWLFPMVFILLLFYFSMRSMRGGMGGGGGMFSIGKSKAQLIDEKSNLNISFKDVAGLEGAKEEVEEVVDFLKNPKKYTELGGRIPKGVLLVGPPGTGKTLLARAVAGEAKVPFFSLSGSDFVEMFVGVGASRVRDLFRTAKEKAPCIIFIDEIDAVGRARGRSMMSGANDERESTLNQLLTEMDGFSSNTGVIILAATNRADVLDRALLRAGRFDRQIHVELPSLTERKEIFGVHVRKLKLSNDVDLEYFAKLTSGFSGADIANVCNEAALIAARHSKKCIEKEDFNNAIDRIIGGLERRTSIISPDEKRAIAVHESGHATVSWLLEHASPLQKVTIVPRGVALGAAWYVPEERHITTREQLFDELCVLLGGRAAEEVVFGEMKAGTGAQNDLERATKQAYAMVAVYGFSDKIGKVSYYDSTGQSDYSFNRPYSEKTAEEIDEEVRKLTEAACNRAKQILTANKDNLTTLSGWLVDREVLYAEDLEKIYGKREFGNGTEIPSSESSSEL
ncbi:MAG: ATP-dependent zinc metalloprotease FtsH [Bacteroidales bacterium]|nr:ATP-dependent zinc metalloprotease FtsH [Bacteroidales bacterium]